MSYSIQVVPAWRLVIYLAVKALLGEFYSPDNVLHHGIHTLIEHAFA